MGAYPVPESSEFTFRQLQIEERSHNNAGSTSVAAVTANYIICLSRTGQHPAARCYSVAFSDIRNAAKMLNEAFSLVVFKFREPIN